MSDLLKAQYEALPYPRRDPEDEGRRVIITDLEAIASVNHFLFGGALDRARPLRALVAGGGTGDALIALAYQMRALGMPGEIVYIDLSERSCEVARARAAKHGFGNLRFEVGSFLETDRFEPASFDYINCCGVLHHLENPLEGLRALTKLLQPRGGMGLMLYGVLGRTGIYPLQEMLRAIAPASLPVAERLRLARALLVELPQSNWLRRNPPFNRMDGSDEELFDLLLHSRDRPYGVAQIAELVQSAGLRLVTFIPPALYRPASYLKNPQLLERLVGAGPAAQAAFAENLAGTQARHEFYVVKADNAVAPPHAGDPRCIPMLCGFPELPASAASPVRVTLPVQDLRVQVDLPPRAVHLLRLIDGERTLGDLERLAGFPHSEFEELWNGLYPLMHEHGYIHISRNPLPNLTLPSGKA